MKAKLLSVLVFIFALNAMAQIQALPHRITDNKAKLTASVDDSKRSLQKPTQCSVDTVEYPRYKASSLFSVTVGKGRGLGQLYACPKPLVLSGFSFYGFVLPSWKTSKKMEIYCRVYKAGADSLPKGAPLRADTLLIDSTFGGGLLTVIEKHANFKPITLDSNYILTVETNDSLLTAGVVTNSYSAGDGAKEWLNCGSISGLWYRGRNLNVGGAPFDCDILLHPHVAYKFGTDFNIKFNCFNINDSVKFINAAPSNFAGSKMYNRYLRYNLGYFCHLWNVGNNTGSQYVVDQKVKYGVKANFKVTLISTVYGYRGGMANGCRDTSIKTVYFKPDMPTCVGNLNVCLGDTAKFTAQSLDTGVVFEWLSKPNASTPFYTGKNYFKYPLTGNDTFYLRANNHGCLSPARMVAITVNKYPSYCTVRNDSVCAGSKANLKANSDLGTILWYTSANSSNSVYSGSVFQTGVLNSDTLFYVQAINNGCALSPRQMVKAFVGSNFAPQSPVLSKDTTVCLGSGNPISIQATAPSGLTIRWFSAASGGSSIHTGNTYNFMPTKRETVTLYADAFNGVCGSSREPVNITVEDVPIISNIVSQAVCKGDSTNLRFVLNFGKADWFDAPSNGNLLTTATYYTVAPNQTTDYYVQPYSSVCRAVNRTKITATINAAPVINQIWGDTICAKNPATLRARITGQGTVEWLDADTSTSILGTGLSFVTPVLNGSRKYYARPSYAGCTAKIVSVQPLVRPSPFSGFSFEVMTWQQVKVSPINAGGAAVKWYFGDGTTSNNSTVTHRYQNTGKYQIKLVLTSPITGCKDSTIVEVQIDPSSIEKAQSIKGLTVYPNPGKQYFFIQSATEHIEGLNLRIMNMTGQVVFEQTMSAEQINKGVQTQSLPAGMYMISLEGHQSFIWIKE